MPNYLDLFAGAGGLSEGFLQEGYVPIAHVEMDKAACYTLRTRSAYKWLCNVGRQEVYGEYLNERINRATFYNFVPREVLDAVLNCTIAHETLPALFNRIDQILDGRELDLIVGGPPCQAYSIVGRARDANNMVGDSRNYLYILYAEFLRKYHPKFFVFENVLGLLSARDQDNQLYLNKMKSLFRECGYSTEERILNAKNYGVLQNRKRIILIGKFGDHEGFYPSIPEIQSNCFVEEIFKDLPFLHAGEGVPGIVRTTSYHSDYLHDSSIKTTDGNPVTLHYARPHTKQDLEIYRIAVNAWNKDHSRIKYNELPTYLQSHKNLNAFLDRFKVVAQDERYAQTVVAHICKDGHYYIHPSLEQNRSITPREAARLQTFPDDYYFESLSGVPSRTSAFKQIGNAVPVRLARSVAHALLDIWDD